MTPDDQNPLRGERESQGPAGTAGLRLSAGSHLLPLGDRGQSRCLDTPRTQRTRGWWRPGEQRRGVSKTPVKTPVHKRPTSLTSRLLCPPGGGVTSRPPTDAGTMLSKEKRLPVWKSQTPGIPVFPTLERMKSQCEHVGDPTGELQSEGQGVKGSRLDFSWMLFTPGRGAECIFPTSFEAPPTGLGCELQHVELDDSGCR